MRHLASTLILFVALSRCSTTTPRMKVTDTFHITFSDDGRITAVRTSSNDPALFNEALQWIQRERPEVLAGPCQGFFDGGPTPRDCVKAVVREFRTFKTLR